MPFQNSSNHYQVSKYIVDPTATDSCYNTIQDAINAANAAGIAATIYIRAGTYTENLTLYSNITLHGDRGTPTTITGTHTPPAAGSLEIRQLTLTSATDILNSAAAGTTDIEISGCFIQVTNGFVFNLLNWTGTLLFDDCGEASTNDGVVNNTGGCTVKFLNTEMGAGNGQTMTLTGNGNLRFDTCNINCPINIGGTGTLVFQESVKCANTITIGGAKIATLTMGNRFENTLTTAGTAAITISNSIFETGANAAISHGSANALTLSQVTINSSNATPIGGAGAGALDLGNVDFLGNSVIAGTITQTYTRATDRMTPYIVGPTGNFATIQAALDAANASGIDQTIWVQPGTYTEDLTLYPGLLVEGSTMESMITGNHTPPSSGIFTFKNVFLTAASGDIFSSAAAGTAVLMCDNCYISVTNGYIYDLPNWTGILAIVHCTDSSANNGIINNTAGATALISNSYAGRGTGNTFTYAGGNLDIIGSRIACPISVSGASTVVVNEGSSLLGNITTADTTTTNITNTKISTDAAQAITHNSANVLTLADVNIDTSNATAIGGSGTIIFGSVTFLDSDTIAGTITQTLTPILKTGEIHAENIQNMDFSGILAWGGAGVYYSVAGNVVTIARPGTGYISGKLISWLGGQSTGALAAGSTHFIYMDSTGTIGTTTARNVALFQDNIVLFEALIDSSGVPNVIVVREDHPYDFPTASSEWAHNTVGSVIANINNGANITLNGTKGIEIVGADQLEDHGLETDIPDSGGAAVTFSFMYTNGAGKWIRNTTANTFPSDYNNGGVVAALGANKYGIFRLYVSKSDLNSATPTYYAVYDDQQYNNLTAANTAIALGIPAGISAELSVLELAQLGFVVKEESSDTIVNVVIEKETARTSFTAASSNQASLILTDVTNFDGWLSAADTTVQAALETLDEIGKGVTVDPAAATDSYVQFDESTTGKWRIGNDATDDSFRISQGSALGTNDTFVMTSSGERTMPLQPAFNAYRGANLVNQTGAGATVTLPCDTERFDQNADYNNATFTFTAPVTGKYSLSVTVGLYGVTAAMTDGQLSLVTSNATYELDRSDTGAQDVPTAVYVYNGNVLVDMDAADTAVVNITVSNGAGNTAGIAGPVGGNTNTFCGYLAC